MEITIRKPTPEEYSRLTECPIWECKPSKFNWYYDSNETSLIIEGEVTVEFDGRSVSLSAGDLAEFPKGLKCVWNVKKTVKKHYYFH